MIVPRDIRAYDVVDSFGNTRTRPTVPAGGIALVAGFVAED